MTQTQSRHPRRSHCRGWQWVSFCLLMACQPLVAETLNEREQAAQQVIRDQMAAFAEDQAEKAFGYASRAIRDQFGSAENFMAVVARDYPAVYRAGFVEFADPVPHRDFLVQPLTLRGPQGRYWSGHYRLVREQDQWRIHGVQLQPVSRGI